ncbi:bacteriophage antitermination protein Q [Klebsiella pneumoniae]|uniref:bacteriophage antitermination protein Q n=1 Tax=Klebsiella pneumoniae TaxID=573 RepID=UPI0029657383|nr:bacteriophage antitermination protein Q [Klebsiella pneumoniae]MCS6046836.1 bacteriophage antitermination protein Q [Klebsiella pneumoniae subsp. pneumoniae]MCS6087124.1 bacteriophage antitermination protein Q [Klebsiella pneumoniae subsp. pneumoniae]MDW1352705.1 bacteriophage antitermination protein Q [Klebsiella pneumoniae]MDW1386465.1 bacteriophage antitermination protein Q [Klebsiella pneumoniae]MDW1416353.1 bacteriophage antitermination protein Q [Klebsiella pneumoniae]
MTAQYLEFVRQQLIVATADLSGATKGQLVAFAENAQFTATARSRGRKKIADPVTGRMVNPSSPPIPGQQSRAKGSSIALVLPVEYSTASWRRALLSLEEHQKSWLLWNYSDNIRWEHQETITRWAWEQFYEKLAGVRIAKKTVDRLRQLIWLAAQDVKAELAGRETYEYQKLAALVGVTPKNWSETFTERWEEMKTTLRRLDSDALLQVTRSRSQQKATNFDSSLAKLD